MATIVASSVPFRDAVPFQSTHNTVTHNATGPALAMGSNGGDGGGSGGPRVRFGGGLNAEEREGADNE